jgi:hypothetical protein
MKCISSGTTSAGSIRMATWLDILTETDEMSSDGNSYRGTNDQKIYITGMPMQEVTGTSAATRIWP